MTRIHKVRKRDGRVVPFQRDKIADAIFRAAEAVGGEDRFLAEELAGVVVLHLERRGGAIPTIEEVQDAVERVLLETGHAKTAKAYILYRERRAVARAERERRELPLVGGSPSREAERWSKARIAEALVARDGLERPEAEEIARRVEERILRSPLPRISGSLLAALVRAEAFDRGRDSRVGRASRVSVPRSLLEGWLERGPKGRRPGDPAAFEGGLGEEVLARHALEHALPSRVAEAHQRGDLHLYDVGAPLRLSALALPAADLLEAEIARNTISRVEGARRAAGALATILRRYGPFAARAVAVEDVNVLLAPFFAPLGEDALAEEVREFLLSPAVQDFPGRGGALRLELGLALDPPTRLIGRECPPPAPPGRCYGDFADEALRVGRAFLHEAIDLRRGGRVGGATFFVPVVRGAPRDAAARALLRQALAAAAEAGDPVIALDDPKVSVRGSGWLRVREDEVGDPLRFDRGDVSVATTTGVNLASVALRTADRGSGAWRGDLDHLVSVAVEGMVARRAGLERRADDPGGVLYPIRRGPVPLVDLEGAFHVLEVVGVDRAVEVLSPRAEPPARRDLRRRMVGYLRDRAVEEGRLRGLAIVVREGLSSEAASRLARLDARRFAASASWWAPGQAATYEPRPPGTGEIAREPWGPDPRRGTEWRERSRHRVDGDRRPSTDLLLAALEASERDPVVVEHVVDPWPRRVVRAEPPEA